MVWQTLNNHCFHFDDVADGVDDQDDVDHGEDDVDDCDLVHVHLVADVEVGDVGDVDVDIDYGGGVVSDEGDVDLG